MTPLFADCLLDRIDHGERQATREDVGTTLAFPHAAVNGWYYLGTPALSPPLIATTLLQGRGRLLRFFRYAVLGPGRDPVVADRRLLAGLAQGGRTEVLPRNVTAGGEGGGAGGWGPLGAGAGPQLSPGSARPPASSCGRWRWWAGRPGRWKAPWPASS